MSVVHQVLWTSGWDSTFRVADLVLTHGRTVQPHYVIDTQRRSTAVELETMERLRDAIAARAGDAGLIRPLRLHRVSDAADEHTARWRRLGSLEHLGKLGRQYERLARVAEREDVPDLELCIHYGTSGAYTFVRDDVVREAAREPDDTYRLVARPSNPDLTLFSYYRFPLLELTKLDMGDRAGARGFGDLMEMTWFCHAPRRGEPCGICAPCRYTREDGLGRRVPNGPPQLARRLGKRLSRPLRRVSAARR